MNSATTPIPAGIAPPASPPHHAPKPPAAMVTTSMATIWIAAMDLERRGSISSPCTVTGQTTYEYARHDGPSSQTGARNGHGREIRYGRHNRTKCADAAQAVIESVLVEKKPSDYKRL